MRTATTFKTHHLRPALDIAPDKLLGLVRFGQLSVKVESPFWQLRNLVGKIRFELLQSAVRFGHVSSKHERILTAVRTFEECVNKLETYCLHKSPRDIDALAGKLGITNDGDWDTFVASLIENKIIPRPHNHPVGQPNPALVIKNIMKHAQKKLEHAMERLTHDTPHRHEVRLILSRMHHVKLNPQNTLQLTDDNSHLPTAATTVALPTAPDASEKFLLAWHAAARFADDTTDTDLNALLEATTHYRTCTATLASTFLESSQIKHPKPAGALKKFAIDAATCFALQAASAFYTGGLRRAALSVAGTEVPWWLVIFSSFVLGTAVRDTYRHCAGVDEPVASEGDAELGAPLDMSRIEQVLRQAVTTDLYALQRHGSPVAQDYADVFAAIAHRINQSILSMGKQVALGTTILAQDLYTAFGDTETRLNNKIRERLGEDYRALTLSERATLHRMLLHPRDISERTTAQLITLLRGPQHIAGERAGSYN